MKYIILTGDGAEELEKQINQLLLEGFVPQGGVSVSAYMDENSTYDNAPQVYCETWAQAMIKLPHES